MLKVVAEAAIHMVVWVELRRESHGGQHVVCSHRTNTGSAATNVKEPILFSN